MSNNLLNLEIITPEKMFFADKVKCLRIETPDGMLGIMANHIPIVIGVISGVIKIDYEDETLYASNGEGFLEITKDKAVLFCQTAEWPEDIELSRVQKAIEENEKLLKSAQSIAEYKASRATINRAFARLRLAKKK